VKIIKDRHNMKIIKDKNHQGQAQHRLGTTSPDLIPKSPEVSTPGLLLFLTSRNLGLWQTAPAFHSEFWRTVGFRRAKFSAGMPINGFKKKERGS
jgi:hypothetical protein